jgi:very-short-patch-repair endonuclease
MGRIGLAPWNKRNDIDGQVVKLFNEGMSVKAISERIGVSRVPVARALRDAGIGTRSRGDAMLLRWQGMGEDERKETVRKAHESTKGASQSLAHRRALARSKSRRIGKGEAEIVEWLTEAGIPVEHQAPIDIYNVDFLAGTDVAIELRVGKSHGFCRPKFRKKVENLLHGHTVVLVWARDVESIIACREQLVADLKVFCTDPTSRGQAWMIRCHRHDFARGRDNLGRVTAVPCPVRFEYSGKEAYPR